MVKENSYIIAFIFCTLLFPVNGQCSSKLSYDCFLSNEFPLKNERKQLAFQASEKIYVYVKFHNLPPGNYIINTTWLKYSGAAERYKTTEIKIDSTSEYTYYSWFKLLKKGPVSQMFMGEEYDFDQRGARKVIIDLNGKRICTKSFEYL